MLGGRGLKNSQVVVLASDETTLASVRSQFSKKGNRVHGILLLRGVLNLGEADLNKRRALEVTCSIIRRIMLSVAELTMESADRAQIPAMVVVSVDIWS